VYDRIECTLQDIGKPLKTDVLQKPAYSFVVRKLLTIFILLGETHTKIIPDSAETVRKGVAEQCRGDVPFSLPHIPHFLETSA
jgi:hypothetical protein